MNTLFISDTYGHHEALLLPRGDMIVHAGDLTKHGTEEEVKDFLQWFSHLNYKYRVFIAGRHDHFFEEHPGKVARILPANVIYLQETGVEVGGINLWGSPFSTNHDGSAFGITHEHEIRDHWNKIPDDSDMVICRTPAYGIHDEDENGEHTGCKELMRKLVRVEPGYFVCGNVNDTHRFEYRYNTNFINASLLNQEYKVTYKPVFLRNQ
jgi:Icc-related predicted phosphoesterase